MFRIKITIAILTISIKLFSQAPSNITWNYFNTENFRIIYPEGIDSVAQEVGNLMEQIQEPVSKPIETQPEKIDLILHNRVAYSNGYVAGAPLHSAYYSTPFSDAFYFGSDNWYTRLAVHEYRHVSQYSLVNRNVVRTLDYIFGDYGFSIGANIGIPDWYFEGDAVVVESVASKHGRGNIPNYMHEYKSLAFNNKRRHYQYFHAHHGSYRKNYATHYQLGYLLCSYIYTKYGENTWPTLIETATKKGLNPYAMSRSLKKHTGANIQKTFDSCMIFAKEQWENQLKHSNIYEYEPITISHKYWTEYSNLTISNGKIYAKKTGFDHTPKIVSINAEGFEESIFKNDLNGEVSIHGELICWASDVADLRWTDQSFSDIYIYSTKEKQVKRLTKKGKYYSPAISPDNSKIAALYFGENMISTIHILSSSNGKIVNSFNVHEYGFPRYIRWAENGESIYFTISKNNKVAIAQLTVATGNVVFLLDYEVENITYPILYKDLLFFNSPITGIDAIHCMNLNTKNRYLAMSTPYGCKNALPYGDSLYFIALNENGSEIAGVQYDDRGFIPLANAKKTPVLLHKDIYQLESNFDSVFRYPKEVQTFESKPYRFYNSLKLHSRRISPSFQGAELAVIADDIMNTTSIIAGYRYNARFQNGFFFTQALYNKYFVQFGATLQSGNVQQRRDSTDLVWQENSLSLTASIPFDFSRLNKYMNLDFGASLSYIDVANTEVYPFISGENKELNNKRTPYNISSGTVISVRNHAYYSFQSKKALRDIHSPFAVFAYLNSYQLIGGTFDLGFAFTSDLAFRFPTFKHHTLELGYSRQLHAANGYYPNEYIFNTSSKVLRGYTNYYWNNSDLATLDYTLPLICPDFNFLNLFYIKRVYANLFADFGVYSRNLSPNFPRNSLSDSNYTYGFDINTEIYFLGKNLPFNLGFRYAVNEKDGSYYTALSGGIEIF